MQAAINAANATALGAKSSKQNYIPTPDVEQAKGIKYDDLYPKVFSNPATYIRFSSTVEDCNQVPYCMDDSDVECLAKLNDGKNASGHPRKDKLSQCSEDLFEEVMSFFTETSARLQPFASLDNAPILSFEEMKRSVDESMSKEAQRWMKHIYQYWVMKKGSSTLMPAIKVRTLEASSEADDADPYVCFRRREVRQTRKTRGRDAQVVEKLKKLRLELEQGRSLLQMVAQREQLNREDLEVSRNVFEQRRKLREVKVQKGIVGEKGEDEELLVNQKVSQPVITNAVGRRQLTSYSRQLERKGTAKEASPARPRSVCARSARTRSRTTTSFSFLTSKPRPMLRSSTPSTLGGSSTSAGTSSGSTKRGDPSRPRWMDPRSLFSGRRCCNQAMRTRRRHRRCRQRTRRSAMQTSRCKTAPLSSRKAWSQAQSQVQTGRRSRNKSQNELQI